MNNKNIRGILALAVVTALSFGVILGSRALSHNIGANTQNGEAQESAAVLEELDTTGFEGIEKAVRTEDGYLVTVRTAGYVGDILMDVSFDADAKHVTKVEVLEQGETDQLGAKIAEEEFLSQFNGVAAPVYLPGMSVESSAAQVQEAVTETEVSEQEAPAAEALVLNDGVYEAKTKEADSNGFIEVMTMTVADGKITEVVWDCIDAEGNKKSVLSENGQYVMTEDGLTWKEQAEALGAALVANQELAALGMNEEGKTDAVSGVSINIMGFVSLAEQCLAQAAGVEAEEEDAAETAAEETAAAETETAEAPADGTQVDAVSGATISSTAAVTGINDAYDFLQTAK